MRITSALVERNPTLTTADKMGVGEIALTEQGLPILRHLYGWTTLTSGGTSSYGFVEAAQQRVRLLTKGDKLVITVQG